MIEKDPNIKASEITSFLKLPVYTRDGVYIGYVKNIFLDMDEKRVSSLLVTNTNPALVDGNVDVAVPYRWVNAVSDIIILSYFPSRVTAPKKKKETKTEENQNKQESTDIDVVQ
ncbi:MAG: PRC-barrel domain-containing protein [Candidatus Thermoplasmatota archaeon]|nr:PRC-barrel domain-containing protein [Candidatus Thermoplasmatota archaeon]